MIYPRRVLYYKVQLQPLELSFIDHELLKRTAKTETDYSPGETMVVWTALMLHRLPFLGELQWQLLLRQCTPFLHTVGTKLAEMLRQPSAGKMPASQLAIVDGRYATWTARTSTGFVDLQTGEDLHQLAFPPLESLSYNLVELARREKRRCDKVQQLLESSDAGAHNAK